MSENDSVLRVEDLRVHFQGKKLVKAVDGVSLEIKRGEVISVVGESGSGKTTLGRTLVGLTRPTSGRILLDGKEIRIRDRKSLKGLWRRAQMIFQDPYSTFNPLCSVYDAIAIPVRKFDIADSDAEVRRIVEESLEKVGLNPAEMRGKYPNQLSGGQRQRASIARALVISPEIIIADEPVSMLDVSIRAGILDVLKNLNEKFGVTIIFITHDLAVADYISDSIAVMYRGKVVELAPSDALIEAPMHPYTELLLRSAPRLKGVRRWSETQDLMLKEVPSEFPGCAFYPRCPISREGCTFTEPDLADVGRSHLAACFVRQDEAKKTGNR
ncbi:MAG: ABC transporter ATP-binding protein [Thaumarchaeota archaeon]|nr:ABC transporter ATP-binding protein [Nitrososphaerota archaeon]